MTETPEPIVVGKWHLIPVLDDTPVIPVWTLRTERNGKPVDGIIDAIRLNIFPSLEAAIVFSKTIQKSPWVLDDIFSDEITDAKDTLAQCTAALDATESTNEVEWKAGPPSVPGDYFVYSKAEGVRLMPKYKHGIYMDEVWHASVIYPKPPNTEDKKPR